MTRQTTRSDVKRVDMPNIPKAPLNVERPLTVKEIKTVRETEVTASEIGAVEKLLVSAGWNISSTRMERMAKIQKVMGAVMPDQDREKADWLVRRSDEIRVPLTEDERYNRRLNDEEIAQIKAYEPTDADRKEASRLMRKARFAGPEDSEVMAKIVGVVPSEEIPSDDDSRAMWVSSRVSDVAPTIGKIPFDETWGGTPYHSD